MTSSIPRNGPDPASRTLVIQPQPGIGDTIWHLPALRAIARAAPEGRVTLLTKPQSLAHLLLTAEPAVAEVLYLYRGNKGKHDGLPGFFRLVALLRRGGFERVWILHHSARYAQVAWAAGVAERHGFGLTAQRWFLNQPPYLPADLVQAHAIAKADKLMEIKNLALRSTDRDLTLSPEAIEFVDERFGHLPRPWIALGLGSGLAQKQWGADNFAALAERLGLAARSSLFLLGGPSERKIGSRVTESVDRVQNALELSVDQSAALLARCRLYVGNDTAALNMAAAVGTDAIGLFGGSPPLTYSPHIHVVLPQDRGRGMAGIPVDQVMAEITRFGLD